MNQDRKELGVKGDVEALLSRIPLAGRNVLDIAAAGENRPRIARRRRPRARPGARPNTSGKKPQLRMARRLGPGRSPRGSAAVVDGSQDGVCSFVRCIMCR